MPVQHASGYMMHETACAEEGTETGIRGVLAYASHYFWWQLVEHAGK